MTTNSYYITLPNGRIQTNWEYIEKVAASHTRQELVAAYRGQGAVNDASLNKVGLANWLLRGGWQPKEG